MTGSSSLRLWNGREVVILQVCCLILNWANTCRTRVSICFNFLIFCFTPPLISLFLPNDRAVCSRRRGSCVSVIGVKTSWTAIASSRTSFKHTLVCWFSRRRQQTRHNMPRMPRVLRKNCFWMSECIQTYTNIIFIHIYVYSSDSLDAITAVLAICKLLELPSIESAGQAIKGGEALPSLAASRFCSSGSSVGLSEDAVKVGSWQWNPRTSSSYPKMITIKWYNMYCKSKCQRWHHSATKAQVTLAVSARFSVKVKPCKTYRDNSQFMLIQVP